MTAGLSRRQFLTVMLSATGALVVGVGPARAAATAAVPPELLGDALTSLGAFVRIERNNRIVIGARGCEIGQGVITSLPMLIAEELDADWTRIRVEQLPYGYELGPDGPRNRYGPQGAGGSTSIPTGWKDLRQAGAVARWLLMEAAAQQWQLPRERLTTEAGHVVHPDGSRIPYAELVEKAAAILPPSEAVPTKSPDQFRVIGKPVRTVDAHAIVTGQTRFGIDSYAGGALTAVIARCPYLDGTVGKVDDSAARAIEGVEDVFTIDGPVPGSALTTNLAAGVVVLARNTWAALKGRNALKIEWKQGPWAEESSARLEAAAEEAMKGEGNAIRADGDIPKAAKGAKRNLSATYQVPFLAHATMEPPHALVKLEGERALFIGSLQDPSGASVVISDLTGINRENIEIRMTRAGGGFGRRLKNDYVAEAVMVARKAGKPVKLMWSRDDDLRHDFYRPYGLHKLAATFDRKGQLTTFKHHCAATPVNYRAKDLADEPAHIGCLEADDFPAGLMPHFERRFFALESGLPRGWWRAPVHAFGAFAVQCFLDELAVDTRQDAVDLRLKLLGEARDLPYSGHGGPQFNTGRLADVLRRCADAIDWKRKRTDGRGVGIACHFTFGGYVAHAFEVSVEGGELRIHRAICVADVGRVVNPLGVDAMMMGGTIDGISTALNLAITVKDGQVQQSSFADYPIGRMAQMPAEVEVIVVPSEHDPSGAGEMGIPTVAPALANAIYAATTVRIRKLPLLAELKRLL
ncbi:xanthine dehydrogenase family protein molybdopterin-binding subunit [Tahibacter amnicola]|uniref:Molybdopterin-dependent oxidoreductase n=1 Tax=Tahibacter amnicola TaxID=2976241 RepID=A0ABY6BFY9_9GAMM|nr:molybdopterin cofactor-binding domain-containing protein [Tahibacter amnicola]UXI67285.1 molybdopterin-dependent oxidoreductase [Tahibacter amnicola]